MKPLNSWKSPQWFWRGVQRTDAFREILFIPPIQNRITLKPTRSMWSLFPNFDLYPAVINPTLNLRFVEWVNLDMANRWKAKEVDALIEMRKRVKDVINARRFQFPEGKLVLTALGRWSSKYCILLLLQLLATEDCCGFFVGKAIVWMTAWKHTKTSWSGVMTTILTRSDKISSTEGRTRLSSFPLAS